jgi:methyltransferase family protein
MRATWTVTPAPAQAPIDAVARLLADRPVFHQGGATRWDALPGTLGLIQAHVRPGDRTLETGCGASTVIFAARGAHHTTVSPDRREHDLVREYCDGAGIDTSRVTFIEGLSDLVLPGLCTERRLDAAFIDGAHAFPFPAVDWHYVTRALKVGGWLLLDDIPIRAVSCVFRYMRSDPAWRLDEIADHRTAKLTLVGEPAPEDWTLQPFNDRPDYAFAPPGRRARMTAAFEARRARRALGARAPALRAAWRRVGRQDTGSVDANGPDRRV